MQKISDRIYSVGVNDDDKVLFEGLWPLPFGVSYNSYIVADEKVALIDTVEAGFEEEFLENINEAIGGRPVDYLVVNHMEPDHSSLISYMLECYPDLKIIANAKTLPMLKGYHNVQDDRVLVVSEGQSVSLGECSLSFHMIPMVHWPETMVTWLPEENTVFSGDAFGTFGVVADDIVDAEETFDQYRDEMIQFIEENNLQDTFILLGTTPNPYPTIKDCTLYVQTSRHEGFGLSIAEARILNRPVVTTEFDAVYNQMVQGKNGIVVPQDPIAVADAIERVLKDKELYDSIVAYQKQEKKGNTEEIEKFYQLID